MLGHGFLTTRMPPCPHGTSLPVSSTTAAMMPGKGKVQEPGTNGVAPGSGVIMWPPVSVCQKVSTIGQRPPPMFLWYHSHAAGLIGSPTEPRMRKRLQVVAVRVHSRVAFGSLDQRADRRRRGVEDADLVVLDHLPEAACVGIGRHAFEDDLGAAQRQRAVGNVGVARHPADVGGTPEHVVGLQVEGPLGRQRRMQQVAAAGMLHALGLSGEPEV